MPFSTMGFMRSNCSTGFKAPKHGIIPQMSIISFMPQAIKRKLRIFLNYLLPTESITESKEKWNSMAKENSRYFVKTNHGQEINEETFQKSGEEDFKEHIEEDSFLIQKLGDLKERSVLEIGCGTGRITEFLARRFKTVAGIDISEEMIRVGKERLKNLPNVRLLATDGLSYPFPSLSFDFVFSFIVFQHMPDTATIRKNFEEISRVLKDGGIGKIQLRGEPTSKKYRFYGPAFDREGVERLLADLPLKVIKTEGEGGRYFFIWFQKSAK